LYSLKVTIDDLERMKKEMEPQQSSPWVIKAVELFHSMGSEEAMLSSEQTATMSEIIDLVVNDEVSPSSS